MTTDVGLAVLLNTLGTQQLIHLAVNDLLNDLRGASTILSLHRTSHHDTMVSVYL